MRYILTFVLFTFMLGVGPLSLAGESPVADAVKKNCSFCADPDSVSLKSCLKNEKSMERLKESGKALPELKEYVAPSKEVKEVPQQKKESSSLTFSFLYYLFYKFSLSDFFSAPSYIL